MYAATGGVPSIASGRLSFAIGLQGPCMMIDTACSAGLVAVHAGLSAMGLSAMAELQWEYYEDKDMHDAIHTAVNAMYRRMMSRVGLALACRWMSSSRK